MSLCLHLLCGQSHLRTASAATRIDHIFEGLRWLQDNHGIQRFIIEDEGFGVSKKFILQFCEKVHAENFSATFAMGVGMRLDQIDEELLRTMLAAGFERTIVLGIESGSDRILKQMKKSSNQKLIWEKITLMKKMGFKPNGYFILGFPGETRQDMEATIRLALKLPIHEASFTAFQPLPSTEATQRLMENGEIPRDYDFVKEIQNSITYAPPGITREELQALRRKAVMRFYLRPRILCQYLTSKEKFQYALEKCINIFFKSNVA